jgi:acyl dehydratase
VDAEIDERNSPVSTATQAFNTEAIGIWGEPVEFAVEQERIAAYAAATNDSIAAHASGELAPPVFAIVPAFQALATASVTIIPAELIMRILHGEQDFHFHAPIRPGTTVATRAVPIGVRGRSSGVTVVVRGETRDAGTGELLVEQYMTSFVRGAEADLAVGEDAPGHAFDESLRGREPDAQVEQTFDADQTFRYSEASGDPMPIHLDESVAKAAGLPGIIIHGLCTMAFTSVAAIQHACPDDPARLGRLAVRFARPVQPGQTITTRLWETDGNLAYETTSDSGEVVIKDGLATVAR